MGDFNSEVSENEMSHFCGTYHFKSLLKEPTCFKNPQNPSCIDLFLTNSSRSFQNTKAIETGISDFHKINLTVLKMYFNKQKNNAVFYRNYKKFDKQEFRNSLDRELLNHDINNIEFETFQNVMISILNKHAPMKQKHIRANHAAFVTKELRKAIMKRTRLRNIFLKKRSENSKALYNKQRNICVSLTRKAKKSYFGNLDAKSVSDNKIFWKRISPVFSNKIKAKEKITLVENEKIISNDLEIANTFNNYFGKIVQNLDIPRNRNHISNTHLSQVNPVLGCIEKFSEHTSIKNIKNRMSNLNCSFKFEYEDKDFFQKEIENLCIKKATQQSDIPVRIMKENNDLCSYILHHSFNNSVSSSVFPNDLKKADITPIYKKDEKFLMTNYRPVSILPNVSKLFERSMFNQISTYFEKLFSKFQCGFRKGYNAQHSLLVLIENIRKILDKKGFAGIVLTDLSKAFDCIDHDLLIAKLQAYGFSIDSLKFIHSYLSDRIQRVKINSSFSKWHKIEFGVPQGSILGPLSDNYLKGLNLRRT